MKRLSFHCTLAVSLLTLIWPCWEGSWATEFSLESSQPDARLSEIEFSGATDNRLSLDHFRGAVVLLNIWATWCAPCRDELPALDRLHGELESVEFHIVALSIDNVSISEIKAFYNNYGIENLPIYIDETGRALHAVKSYGVPTTLLIDRQGTEIGRVVGPVEWDKPEVVAEINRYIASKP